MEDTRKGWLTPDQEKTVDDLIELNGVLELVDGTAIKIADNKGGQMLKDKLTSKYGTEILPDIYEVIDILFAGLKEIVEAKK